MHFKHLSLAVFTAFFSILGLTAFADSDPATGYTRLNCIETSASVSSFPYIGSGLYKQDNLYVEFDIARTKASTSYLMGAFGSSAGQNLFINDSGYVQCRTDGVTLQTTTLQAPGLHERFVLKAGWGNQKVTVAIGESSAQVTSTKTVATYTKGGMPLFASASDGSISTANGAYCLVYGVKMYTGCTFDDNGALVSGTLVRDFVPCLNDATGKAGLYDRVNSKWYGSARNDHYPFGAAASQRVNLPANIIRVDYVDTEGAAIDTGLTQQDGYRIDAWARAPATDFSATPCVFGNANFRLGNFVKYNTTVQGSWRAYNGASIDAGAGSNYRAYPGQPFRARAYWSGTKTALYAFDTLYTKTGQKAVSTTSDTLYLGSYTTTVSAGRNLRIYSAKIYTGATGFEDGTLARDYIPAYDLTTQKYGVYDCVNGVFSSSATEGTEFTGASHLMGSIKVAGSTGKTECFWQPNAADDSYGDFAMAHGASKTFTAPTGTHPYGGQQVIGYRIDTWDGANSKWIEGTFVDSLTCNYTQNYTERKRLAWVWDTEWVKLSTVADDTLVDYSYVGTAEGGYSDGYAVKGAPLTCTVTMKAEKVADMYDFANLSDAWVRKSGTYTIVGTLYPDSNPAVVEIPTPRVVPIQWMDGFFKELPGDEVAVAFTNITKTHTFTIPENVTSISRYLVVGGGGGGGGDGSTRLGGGGGGGGVVTNDAPIAVTGGSELTITIGRGGTGGASATTNTICGASSTLAGLGDDTIEALGGGGGGGFQNKAGNRNGVDGGCGGGGAAGSSTVIYTGGKGSQGYDGGQSSKKANNLGGSGGGGAGGPGGNSTGYSTKDGYGGPGLLSDITGEDSYYAAGGGGGGYSSAGACPGGSGIGGTGKGSTGYVSAVNNGKDATGSGGGGIGYSYYAGGKGGDGVVIIRYTAVTAKVTVNITNDADKDEYTATAFGAEIASGDKITSNAVVTVVATPKSGFVYDTIPEGWSEGETAGTITRDFTAETDPTAIAIPDPKQLFTLTINPTTNGSITGADSETYPEGTVLTLTAEPADGYRFGAWTDDVAGEEANPLEITITADLTVGATFEQLASDERLVTYEGGENTTYSVKVDDEDVASGSSVKIGKTVVAVVTPDVHYSFASTPEGWTACEPAGSFTRSFTVASEDIDFVIPSAAPIMFTLTVTQPVNGTITGTESGSHLEGTEVTLNANVPDETYELISWTGDKSGTENPLVFTLNVDTAVGANIAKIARAVTFTAPENTTVVVTVDDEPIESGASVEIGKSVVVVVTPAEHYEYLTAPENWEKSGDAITRTYTMAGEALEIEIPSPTAIPQYTLTITAPENGTITGTAAGTYYRDTEITLSAAAAHAYSFAGWTGDKSGTANPLVFALTADTTVGATFEAMPDYLLEVDYIQSTAAQTLDTGIGRQNNLLFDFVFEWTSIVGNSGRNLCGQYLNDSDRVYVLNIYNGKWRSGVNDNFGHNYTFDSPAVDKRYSVQSHFVGTTTTMTLDGESESYTGTAMTSAPTKHFYLFGRNANDATTPASAKLYSCKIYTNATTVVSGVLARDYVPVYNYKTGVYGLYDTVTRTFSPSATSTGFKGPSVPARYVTVNIANDSTKDTFVATTNGVAFASGDKVEQGKDFVVTATPVEGYHYQITPTGWTKNADGSIKKTFKASENPTDVAVPDAALIEYVTVEVTNDATKDSYVITTGGIEIASGTVVVSNSTVVVTATPVEHYEYLTAPEGWTLSNGTLSKEVVMTTAPTTAIAVPDATVKAKYTLTITAPTNGKIKGSEAGTYDYDVELTLVAVPKAGYHFTGWTGIDADVNPLVFTLDSDRTISATFAEGSQPYTELEFIESTGRQWIDTEFFPANGYSYALVSQVLTADPRKALFGSSDNDAFNDTATVGFRTRGSTSENWYRIRACYHKILDEDTQTYAIDNVTDLYAKHTYEFRNGTAYVDGTLKKAPSATDEFTCTYSLYIGAVHTPTEPNSATWKPCPQRIYRFTIKDTDGSTLLHDFVPCRRESDGEIGMYDKVTSTFRAHSGAAPFFPGPTVAKSYVAAGPGKGGYHTTITIGGYTGASTLTDVPVLVRISSEKIAGFKYSQCPSTNLTFSADAEGYQRLAYEIDEWNPEGESLVWVRVPKISGQATQFHMFWGVTAYGSNPRPTDVWGDYVGVWHFNGYDEVNKAILDSTAHGNALINTVETAPTSLAAEAGKGLQLFGKFQTCDFDYQDPLVNTTLNLPDVKTISFWFKAPDGLGNHVNLLDKYINSDSTGKARYGWCYECNGSDSATKVNWYAGNKSGTISISTTPSSPTTGFVHEACVMDGTSAITAYTDGTKSSGTLSIGRCNVPFGLGALETRSFVYDELRISRTVMSADRIKADRAMVENADYLTNTGAERRPTPTVLILR